ncbi:efflux transporter [Obba rivulosa]|uniref:Efflux transporter n=1 Tax=Obba rivulosa TaxID=1052685 RepID=A0A8E2AT08_9APHY|nr:efflux transporter [Obba rivulosa]
MSRWQLIGIVATCTLSMILNIANSTAVAIALPTIGRDINIPEYRLQWVVSAYSLSSGCLLLFFGRIADLYGRKLCFNLGIIFMAVFALGCGFAQDEITIDILRGLQGIGGAACIPAAIGILAHAFPPSKARSVAFATFGAGAPVGGAIGSLIGGVLTQLTRPTWRSTFFFTAGLGGLCLIGSFLTIPKDHPSQEADRRIDWLGAFLVTAALTLIIFVLSDGTIAPQGWRTPYIIALIIIGVVFLGLYIAWQYYLERIQDSGRGDASRWTPPPLMRISIWGRDHGRLAVMLCIAFLEWCGFLSWQFWAQLYYQNYENYTPVLTMVRFIPMFITGVLCNVVVALVVGRIPGVILIVFGTALTSVASLLFANIIPSATYWAFGFPAAVVSVFGADFVFSSGTLFVAKVCLPHEQSVGGALFQTLTQLGTSFGLAISTIVYNSTLSKASLQRGVVVNINGTNAPRSAQLVAYKDAMWTGFAFGIAGSVLAAIFLRNIGIIGHRKGPKPDSTSETTALDGSGAPGTSETHSEKRREGQEPHT